ncbi:MAG: MFS transporter [SAR202 cluster bacterium]|nr:MFS transporter [SAR202 cluster bacterium]|tara:strand:- start:3065 stop:4321 length:1257 start_codon:yes stop_codon:yes gene_type:complete
MVPEEQGSNSRLGALAFRDFRFYWIHGLFQGIARNMRELLTFYLVFELSGSALQLGITGVFQGVPILIFGLLGGAMADSFDRKRLLIYTQLANVIFLGIIASLVLTGWIMVWHLWVLASLASAVNALGRPAQRAYLPRMVPRVHVMNAITWFGALSQGTLFVGPMLAAILIASVGVGWAFLLNAVILLGGAIATFAIKVSGAQEGTPSKVSIKSIWEGVQFLRTREVLFGSYLLDFGVMSFGFFRPLMPVLAVEVYQVGEIGLGLLTAAPAVGSIIASGLLLVIGDIRKKGMAVVLSYVGYAVGLIALGCAPWFWMALGVLVILGLMDVISFTVRQALIQLVAPDNYRGRAGSFSTILAGVGNSTGSAEMGALAGVIGAPFALIINGIIGLAITGSSVVKWPGLWAYDEREQHHSLNE